VIRLLLADDHEIVRDGIKFVVSQTPDIQVIGEVADADALLQLCSTVEADVVLLDVSMSGPGVLETIQRVRQIRPHLRILVLSVHPEQHYAKRVLRAGADGYLTKNHSSDVLATAIRQVHSGRKYVSPTLAQDLALELSADRIRPAHEILSNREYDVLVQLGSGQRVDEIASRLGLSSKTVRTYRARIMEKLDLKSTAQLIFYAVSRRIVPEVPPRFDPDPPAPPPAAPRPPLSRSRKRTRSS
jgi:DNA-binding NarL/FixJ family response regulator